MMSAVESPSSVSHEPRRSLASGFSVHHERALVAERRRSLVRRDPGRREPPTNPCRFADHSGRERLVAEVAGSLGLSDVSRRGQALVGPPKRAGMRSGPGLEEAARRPELAAADLSFLADLSDDGKTGTRHGRRRGRGPQLLLGPGEDGRLRAVVARGGRRPGLVARRSFRSRRSPARLTSAARGSAHGRRRDAHPRTRPDRAATGARSATLPGGAPSSRASTPEDGFMCTCRTWPANRRGR